VFEAIEYLFLMLYLESIPNLVAGVTMEAGKRKVSR